MPGFDPYARLPRKLVRQLDPFAQVAAHEALTQAGLLGAGENGVRVPLADGAEAPHLDRQDPPCDLDVAHGGPQECEIGAAVSNSFGFGGHNAVLVFRRA